MISQCIIIPLQKTSDSSSNSETNKEPHRLVIDSDSDCSFLARRNMPSNSPEYAIASETFQSDTSGVNSDAECDIVNDSCPLMSSPLARPPLRQSSQQSDVSHIAETQQEMFDDTVENDSDENSENESAQSVAEEETVIEKVSFSTQNSFDTIFSVGSII